MKRRVVITGLGAITPIGNTVEEFWNGIKNGTVGIGPITKFDTTEYKVKIASQGLCCKGTDGFQGIEENGNIFPVCGCSGEGSVCGCGI